MYLMNFARVGKSFLRSITGVQENFKIVKEVSSTDLSVCFNCPFFENTSEVQSDYCHNYCNESKITKTETTYYNEGNRYHISTRERLSKMQLKQILLYHFLGVDKNGVVKNISTKDIAEYLKCDIKTVKNNNRRFVELNYILYSESSSDKFTIWLTDYKNYHLAQREGGSGYVNMSKQLLSNLIEVDNVNSLRLELRNLIEFDNQNIQSDEVKEGKYTYRDVKRFLPKYLHYKGAIEEVINNGSNSFEIVMENNFISFKLKDNFNSKILREDIISKCETSFDSYFDKFNFDEDELIDIFQMSIQYGIDRIRESLDIIYEDYIVKSKYIHNLGGLVRTITTLQGAS